MGEFLESPSTRPCPAREEGVGKIGLGMSEFREERTVDSRVAFQGRHINVRVDTVRLANGRLTTREIAGGTTHDDAVCIVPLDGEGGVYLVRQYRKAVERSLLEVPAGGMEPGEDPEDAARRELAEETGCRAQSLERLAFFYSAPGFLTEGMYAYLATGLSRGADSPDEDENIEVVKIPLKDVPSMIESGQIQDGKSIAALMLVMAKF